MKTTSHTPGPWIIRDRTGTIGNPALGIEGPGCEVIASVIYNDGFNTLQSNACLVASAPELLEACKLVRDAFKSARPWQLDDLGFKGAETALDAIDAAILKAEGSDE